MLSTLEKYCKMMIYGTFGTACILAQIEPGQSAHLETLRSFGIVSAGTAIITAVFVFIPPFSLISNMIWRAYDENPESSQ